MAVRVVVWGAIKTVALTPFRWLYDLIMGVVGNPIIGREMRVRMRFARSFWLQGAYLLFLIVVVSLAYQIILASSPIRSLMDMQFKLQSFYYTLLYSLISIVVLVAPALTASALSFERERRTLDLLLVTPLSPMQILTGKLIASVAFLVLLLVLSMPIMTVCLLVGGATLGDLLATYALIIFSLLHLCAFSLYCSACNRTSGVSTFWAYLGVFSLLLLLSPPLALEGALTATRFARAMGVPHAPPLPDFILAPLSSLNPFSAPFIKAAATELFGMRIPCWLFSALFSLFLTRFWLTASAARLPALYRGNPIGSLRRQGLLLTVLVALSFDPIANALTGSGGIGMGRGSFTHALNFTLFLLVAALFIPTALIVPFTPWITTFGKQEGNPTADDGWFRPQRIFRPVASGALPFLWLWFLCAVGATTALWVWRLNQKPLWEPFLWVAGYCLALLTFLWSMGRFWSSLLGQLTPARWVTLGTLILLFILPWSWPVSPIYPVMSFFEVGDAQSFLDHLVTRIQSFSLPILLTATFVLSGVAFLFGRFKEHRGAQRKG